MFHYNYNFKQLLLDSFIHYEVLYSAPSRLLLRSAPDPSTAEKDSFEASIERFRVDSGMQAQHQREPFQREGPTTEKARFCLVAVRAKGTMSTPRSVERRERRPGAPKVGHQRSRR